KVIPCCSTSSTTPSSASPTWASTSVGLSIGRIWARPTRPLTPAATKLVRAHNGHAGATRDELGRLHPAQPSRSPFARGEREPCYDKCGRGPARMRTARTNPPHRPAPRGASRTPSPQPPRAATRLEKALIDAERMAKRVDRVLEVDPF